MDRYDSIGQVAMRWNGLVYGKRAEKERLRELTVKKHRGIGGQVFKLQKAERKAWYSYSEEKRCNQSSEDQRKKEKSLYLKPRPKDRSGSTGLKG